ncbi:MAG TPA: hypothetical protein VGK19_23660 [Capsulimonadaceae bacterium]|jgi:hypothetical protein
MKLTIPTIIALLAFCMSPLAAAPTEMLTNPGFEAPFTVFPAPTGKAKITGAIARGWNDNSSWAPSVIEYAEARTGAHGGSSAQAVTVKEAPAQFVQSLDFVLGHIYSVSIWFKGTPGTTATVALRIAGPPYTTLGDAPVQLNGQWQQAKFSATCRSAAPGYIMIYPPLGTTLLVDDASVVDVSQATSDAPAKVGNMLPDASFEAGFSGGWAARLDGTGHAGSGPFAFADPRPSLDSTTAFDQKQSLKVTLPYPGSASLTSPLVSYNYGRVYTASIAMKASADGASARIQMAGSDKFKDVTLTTSWQRFSLSAPIPFGTATRLSVRATSRTAATIWFDAADLHEGDTPTPAGPPPVELALNVDRPGGVFFDGEPAVIRLATANAPAGSTVKLTCLDLYNTVKSLPSVATSATAITVAPDASHPRGMFKLTAQVVGADGAALSPPIQQAFARLPKPREIAPEKSFFGVHVPLSNAYFAICRAIGARWTRIHDASWVTIWPVVEPKEGQFQYEDAGADAAKKSGIAILGMLDGVPMWATKTANSQGGYFSVYNKVDGPRSIDLWKVYVQNVVSHYKGKIDHWEVWNEPYGGQFTPGPAEVYGTLLKTAYPVAKAANPKATIVGVDTNRGFDDWTDTVMKTAGGSSSYDEFSYHDYYGSLYGGPSSVAAKDAAVYNAVEKKYGKITPRWVTEAAPGEEISSFYWPIGEEQLTRSQCAKTIRFDVTLMANGVVHDFYYSLHSDPPYGSKSLMALEHDRTIRPLMAARAVLAALVDGAKCLGRTEPLPGVDCYSFHQPDGRSIDVLWSYDNATHQVPVSGTTRILDALGNVLPPTKSLAIGLEPVYVIR